MNALKETALQPELKVIDVNHIHRNLTLFCGNLAGERVCQTGIA
jgi:hypothetical protein